MQSCRLRAGSPSRFFAALLSLSTVIAPARGALAQPGSLYAMTPYEKCAKEMLQIEDVNGDGKLDFVCINGNTSTAAPGGISLLSGVRGADGRLPVLAYNHQPGLGGRVVEVTLGATKLFAACHNTNGGVVRLFHRTTLAELAIRDVGYYCSGLKAIDLDNDGRDELLVSSSALAKVEALRITAPTTTSVAVAPLFAYTRADLAQFGAAITSLDDVNGDGIKEWAVGAPEANGGRGLVAIMLGNISGTVPLQIIDGATSTSGLGRDLAHLDLSGDGSKELLVSAVRTTGGDSAIHQFNIGSGALQLTRSITRAAGDGLGVLLSERAVDVNGDNVPDMAANFTGGTAIISGRSFEVIKEFAGFTFRPSLIVEQAHHDPHRVYGGIVLGKYTSLPGDNNNSNLFHITLADKWGCPDLNVALAHSPSEYAGVFGNDGQVPTITVPHGCAVPGGDLVIQSDMSPNAPAVVVAGPQMSNSPFPAIASSANKLVVKRDTLEALEPAFAPANGIASVVVRSITPTLTDPDGAGPIPQELRWFIQAIQFGQFAPTAQASGKGIASSMGYQLRAVQ